MIIGERRTGYLHKSLRCYLALRIYFRPVLQTRGARDIDIPSCSAIFLGCASTLRVCMQLRRLIAPKPPHVSTRRIHKSTKHTLDSVCLIWRRMNCWRQSIKLFWPTGDFYAALVLWHFFLGNCWKTWIDKKRVEYMKWWYTIFLADTKWSFK